MRVNVEGWTLEKLRAAKFKKFKKSKIILTFKNAQK
jgi:hypothetical protein